MVKKIDRLFLKFPFAKYVTAAVAAAIVLIIPHVMVNDYLRLMINLIFVYSIVLFGLNFIAGLVGQMNSGMAAIYALGAYTSGLLGARLGISPWLSIIAALVTGLLLGVIIGFPSLKVKGIYLVLSTLAFGQIIKLLLSNMTWLTYGTFGVRDIPNFEFFGGEISTQTQYYYFLLVWLIVLAIIANTIVQSKWGRAFKAVRDNELTVSTCGINVASVKVKAFVLCTVFGCVAGALYAPLMGYLHPDTFSGDLSIRLLMCLIVGGIGSVTGNIIGAVFITALPEMLKFMGRYYWVVFCLIVMIFVIRIQGGVLSIFSKHEDKIERLDRIYKLRGR